MKRTDSECTTLRSKTRKRTIRNVPSEESNIEVVDGASDKTVAAWVGPLVSQHSTGSTLESK